MNVRLSSNPLYSASRVSLWQWALAAALLVTSSIWQWSHAALHPAERQQYTVKSEVVVNAIVAHVKAVAEEEELYNPDTDELGVDVLHVPEQPLTFFTPLPSDADSVSVSVDSTLRRQFRHQAYIRVALQHPSGERHTLGVPVRLSLTKDVWVAKDQIKPGTPLDASKVVSRRRTLTHQLDRVIPANQSLSGHVARIMVLEGEMVKTSDVAVPLAVRSQSFVKIQMIAGAGVNMMIEGKALEDGHVGDLIRVRNRINPNRLYTATVVAPGRVRVKL